MKYPYVLKEGVRKLGKRRLPGDDPDERLVWSYQAIVLSEGVEVKKNDVVYVNGGDNELLVAILNTVYRVFNSDFASEEDSRIVVDVSWMYRWSDMPDSTKPRFKCFEKLRNETLPDGHRELMFTAHRDTIDIASIRRPIKVWFMSHKKGKGKLPEVTFYMAGKVRTEPAKGFVCTRFMDTTNGKMYPLEQVRADVGAHTFEDDLIPQVTSLMKKTEDWLREIKINDIRVRKAHAPKQPFRRPRGSLRLVKRQGSGQRRSSRVPPPTPSSSGHNATAAVTGDGSEQQTTPMEIDGVPETAAEVSRKKSLPEHDVQEVNVMCTPATKHPQGMSVSGAPGQSMPASSSPAVNKSTVDDGKDDRTEIQRVESSEPDRMSIASDSDTSTSMLSI